MDELTKKLTEALAEAATQRARADALDAQLVPLRDSLTRAEVAATNAKAELATQKTAMDAAVAVERARAEAVEKTARDTAEQSKLDAASNLGALVKVRVALETAANRILGSTDAENKPIDRSGLSDRDIQIAVISHVDGMTVPADKPAAWYEGVYDGAVSRAKVAVDSIAVVRQVVSGPVTRQDGAPIAPLAPGRLVATGIAAERAARQEMADRKRAGKA